MNKFMPSGIFEEFKQSHDLIDEYKDFYRDRLQNKYKYIPHDKKAFDMIVSFCAYYWNKNNARGLFLYGGTGNGKTMALKIIAQMFNLKVLVASELVAQYREGGYGNTLYWALSSGKGDLIIDDIGDEPTVNDYGNKFELIGQLISDRYREFSKRKFTLISSNLTPSELQTRYGVRVWSRINEMCTIVPFVGNDKRFEA